MRGQALYRCRNCKTRVTGPELPEVAEGLLILLGQLSPLMFARIPGKEWAAQLQPGEFDIHRCYTPSGLRQEMGVLELIGAEINI